MKNRKSYNRTIFYYKNNNTRGKSRDSISNAEGQMTNSVLTNDMENGTGSSGAGSF